MNTDSINKNSTLRELRSFLYVILIALAIRVFIMELFFVPTGSMKATILEGDYIFSTKYSYGYSKYSFPFGPDLFKGRLFSRNPQRGDVVIFKPTANIKEPRFVKRLIGLPGDKIQLIDDLIYINDIPILREPSSEFIDEQGQKYKKFRETLPNGVSYYTYNMEYAMNALSTDKYNTTAVFHVPHDCYFFLGDNRYNSNDSRSTLGFVPFENFIAKGRIIVFSTKELLWSGNLNLIEQITQIPIWIQSIRFERMFTSI